MELRCDYAALPAALTDREQWVGWRAVPRGGRPTKVPVNVRNGKLADATDPASWATLGEAIPYVRRHDIGLGFVLAEGDPFACVDLDDCRDPATGALADWAAFVAWHLDAYAEASPSGRGVHLWVRGTLPAGRRRAGPIELYDRFRFLTVTGARLADHHADIPERGPQLANLHRLIFPPAPPSAHTAPIAIPADLTDDEVIRRAGEAANGHKFRRLWAGDTSGYASRSEADAALVALLRFWVGDDADRLDGLFRRSGLCRGKWEDREDYRRRTIALAADGAVYAPRTAGVATLRALPLPARPALLALLAERRGA